MATMPEPRPVESGFLLSCDSASSRVNFNRFLNAFSAPFSCSFVGSAGGVGSDIGTSSGVLGCCGGNMNSAGTLCRSDVPPVPSANHAGGGQARQEQPARLRDGRDD